MDLARARMLVKQLGDTAKQLDDALAETPAATSVPIATADGLDRALSTAVPGQVLRLEPTFVYPAPLKIVTKGLTLTTAGDLAAGRMTADRLLPKVLGGLQLLGDGTTVIGVEVRRDGLPSADIVTFGGAHLRVDRCRVLGDPVRGAKRGINANGNGDTAITRCYVDDAFGPYPGPDTQAVFAADMAPGLVIEDNFLRGGSETILIGGDDPLTAARMPADVTIRGNTITKRAEWMTLAVNVKNLLEVKAGRRITIADNDGGLSWGGHGQDGYVLMLTVRNQEGRAPWSTIEDVDIVGNHWTGGAAAINILGADNLKPSGRMARIRIRENTIDGLDPKLWVAPGKVASARLILIDRGPDALAITDNVFQGVNLSSALYLQGQPQSITNFTFTGNTLPKTTYGLKGDGDVPVQVNNWTETNAAWARFVASGVIRDNKVTA